MDEQGIFRKASLERLSTPEQLDYLMQVTTPKGWYALWTLCALIVLAIIWSVFGSIPTTISGPAIIMPPRGVDNIYSPGTGIVKQIFVAEGDLVTKDEVVATLDQSSMAQKGARSAAEINQSIAATKEHIRSLDRQVRAMQVALKDGLIAPDVLETAKQNLARAQSSLKSLENQIALNGMELKEATDVIAPKSGRIVEVMTSPGTLIQKGSFLMTYVDEGQSLNAIAFIPSVGNQAKSGMAAEVSPRIIKKEEYGYLTGQVYYVSEFPAREQMIFELTRNNILDQELTAGGAPYILRISLDKDSNNFSGYRWSSSEGPQLKIKAGMMCDVRIIVKKRRPITLVIPAMKSLLGL